MNKWQLHTHNGIDGYHMSDKTYDNHWCFIEITNNSKGNEESPFLRTGFSRAISRLSFIFGLKSFLSLVKIEKSSKDGE